MKAIYMRHTFGVTLTQIPSKLGIPYKPLKRIIQQYEKNPKLYLVNIMNNRPQPTEFIKISESICILIDTMDTLFTARQIQNFVQVNIDISLKREQIILQLLKELKMAYRWINLKQQ